ncbi:MFS transporter [Roseibacillus persicicus]|uniref:MFS transporter n=2 Tax=Roseibacillus persicicus TaxID=454148 RepID=A0A918TRP4_9BACT|nr:MFS transporter [Roseibacillus persicicus]
MFAIHFAQAIMSKYETKPGDHVGMPPGIPYIISNEAAERFSFYGMRTILVIFMTKYLFLMDGNGGTPMSQTEATAHYHDFVAWVYFTPLLGALLSDVFLGKYRTIILLSIVYCLGHAALACMGMVGSSTTWLFAGLLLITIGSGGIKPCVSAHVGDQFGKTNSHLLTKIYNWFYFSINLGSFVSTLMTPWLLEWYGPHWAFGVPGVLMALATLLFWLGRHKFIHVPPGGKEFFRELTSKEGLTALGKLIPLYIFIAAFWALFDQTGSSWVFQAAQMDRDFLGVTWLESQIQALNPILILTFIPLFTFLVYPAVNKVFKLTPLRKIGIGLFVMAASFGLVALIQTWIDAGERPSIAWQLLAFVIITASEVMVSIVALEFSYTQAPKTMKSMVMAVFLLSVFVGNKATSWINSFILIDEVELVDKKPHPGFDGKVGTADDLVMGEESIGSPVTEELGEGLAQIEAAFAENERLPSAEEGKALLAEIKDPWGAPLRYTLLSSSKARISSDGPDKESKTQWDLGTIVGVKEINRDAEGSWLAKRKIELGIIEEEPDPNASPLSRSDYAGGQTKLEGASYFMFFTWLMFGTAVAYVPFAFFYREKTYLND